MSLIDATLASWLTSHAAFVAIDQRVPHIASLRRTDLIRMRCFPGEEEPQDIDVVVLARLKYAEKQQEISE